MSMLGPNFFIVGAPKCGTTALYTYLSSHPDIFFPERAKEPHHFNSDMPGFRWYPERDSYLALFAAPEAQAAKVRGEASVQYLYSSDAAAGIARDYAQARILVCLRQPVDFIRSYHNQMLVNLDEDLTDLGEAWAASSQTREVAREPRMLDYKSVGLFAQQIDRYRKVFPDDQIRVMSLEDFKADPRGHYLALLDWLGVPDDGRRDFAQVHAAHKPRSRALAAFVKSPPPWARRVVRGLKTVSGRSSLGVAQAVRKANTAGGYANAVMNPDLAAEIDAYYAADQQDLAKHDDLRLMPR